MIRFVFIALLSFIWGVSVEAQPSNDDCANPVVISIPTDLSQYCSDVGAFTTIGATSEGLSSSCFGTVSNDVWFTFTAWATDVTITINGNSGVGGGGSLNSPQVELLVGTCSSFSLLVCESSSSGIVELYKGGLIVGQTYYFRVDGIGNSNGSFQVCINNYNPPADPQGDCPEASILCDKSPFVVQSVTGAGNDNTELKGLGCADGVSQGLETNSTWFTWICDEPGSLTFALSPLNGSDDLDFAVFEIPNGIGDCSGKTELRCMFSGEDTNCTYPTCPCLGVTGLKFGDPDISENAGCGEADDNAWLAPLIMTSGTTYALVVNNFSSTGNGFSVDFGGTGTFLGPHTEILSDAPIDHNVCYGESMTFWEDSEFELGNITGYSWSFGPDAVPQTASGQGPHEVSYSSAGVQPVVLTLNTDLGCMVTKIDTTYQVDSCCLSYNEVLVDEVITPVDCAYDFDGSIDLDPMGKLQPYEYIWNDFFTSEDRTGLSVGQYSVTITNELGCQKILVLPITGPAPISGDTAFIMPTCDGGMDGAITVYPNGGVSPYEFSLDGGAFTSVNYFSGLSVGEYSLVIRDNNGCLYPMVLDLHELELLLDPEVEAVKIPTCFGDDDGEITLGVINGQPSFEYDWQDGAGFTTNNSYSGLTSGTYTVDIRDANNCLTTYVFEIVDFPPLEMEAEIVDASCFGEDDGAIIAHAGGGAGNYIYNWEFVGMDSVVVGLEAGLYYLTITDANNCEKIEGINVGEPPELFVEPIEEKGVLCYGDETGILILEGSGGVPGYQYSLDGIIYYNDSIFTDLPANIYEIFVKDAKGCVTVEDAEIIQPLPIIVNLGQDTIIELGATVNLTAYVSPYNPDYTYTWSPEEPIIAGCTSGENCETVHTLPTGVTEFEVVVQDTNGCSGNDKILIEVVPSRSIFIPTGFTPNGDGRNDYFTIFGGSEAESIVLLRIFDRWGGLVFERKDFNLNSEVEGWDGFYKGKVLNPGVFTYYAEVLFLDKEIVIYQGDITLIR